MTRGEARLVMVILAAVIVFTATDVSFDQAEGASVRHILAEVGVILSALAGVVFVLRRALSGYHDRLRQSEAASERWRADAERWRAETAQLLRGLSEAIERQFHAWGLTRSEQEVGFLLLKGLSLKDVAAVRGVEEKTIRNQSLAIYRKAGLGGRAELAAFFLEDLLAPSAPAAIDRSADDRDESGTAP